MVVIFEYESHDQETLILMSTVYVPYKAVAYFLRSQAVSFSLIVLCSRWRCMIAYGGYSSTYVHIPGIGALKTSLNVQFDICLNDNIIINSITAMATCMHSLSVLQSSTSPSACRTSRR